MSLHVLSYNIHWGLSTFRRRMVIEHLAKVIEQTEADIVLLQELWLPQGAIEFILVDALKHTWPHQLCQPTVVLDRGEQGNGILSRHCILESHHESFRFHQRQDRRFLHVRVQVNGMEAPVSVICTHFGLLPKEREFQADRLAHYIESRIAPEEAVIIGGDFNDWREELSPKWEKRLQMQEVHQAQNGRHAKTYPALFPMFSLDRIYVRHLAVKSARVWKEAGWRGSSDHLPISADLAGRTPNAQDPVMNGK